MQEGNQDWLKRFADSAIQTRYSIGAKIFKSFTHQRHKHIQISHFLTGGNKMGLKTLMGSGDKIMRAVAPFLVIGVILNILKPAWFAIGTLSGAIKVLAMLLLAFGIIIWLWSVILILVYVPKKELIIIGPYALVKHPLYTGVALLVLPWLGFLLNTWLGLLLGMAMYFASRKYAPEEEKLLAKAFGPKWDAYKKSVKLPWI
jgi:protein-S-isoprenylcysteine O-methyltransferase Ste14